MKIVAVICNVVLFVFTCFVLVTDGISKEAAYIVFTLLLLLVPILSFVVIFRSGVSYGWLGRHIEGKALEEQRKVDDLSSMSTIMKMVVTICNIVLLGFACWAIVSQYPHPEEDGVVVYTILVLLTPILSMVVLLRSGTGRGWLGLHMKRKAIV
jgi:hypothetical protein